MFSELKVPEMKASEDLVWKRTGMIGSGAFGKVYSAFRSDDPKRAIFAIKVSTSQGESNRILLEEIDIHSRLTHPDIVRYVNSYDLQDCGGVSLTQALPGEGKCIAMVLEYLEGKDLATKLKAESEGLPYRDVQKLAKNMVSAILYLKEQKIVHRDIKPANIFIDSAGRYKLGDFGLAIKEEDIPRIDKTKIIGTPLYMAAEILLISGTTSYASDMWSLGAVLFEAFQGSSPWIAGTLDVLRRKVSRLEIKGTGFDKKHAPLEDFIMSTLVLDPADRLSVEEALGHPLLQMNKTPANEEEAFVQDIKEFGQGSRTDFYIWLANKYPDRAPSPWAEFSEKYDRLYLRQEKSNEDSEELQ